MACEGIITACGKFFFSVNRPVCARRGKATLYGYVVKREFSASWNYDFHGTFSPLLPWNTHFDFSTSPGEWAKVLSFLDCRILPFLSLKRTIGPERVFFKFLYAKSTSKTLKSEVENANAARRKNFLARGRQATIPQRLHLNYRGLPPHFCRHIPNLRPTQSFQ